MVLVWQVLRDRGVGWEVSRRIFRPGRTALKVLLVSYFASVELSLMIDTAFDLCQSRIVS